MDLCIKNNAKFPEGNRPGTQNKIDISEHYTPLVTPTRKCLVQGMQKSIFALLLYFKLAKYGLFTIR